MRLLSVAFGVGLAALLTACSGDKPSPPSMGDGDGTVIQLSGGERLGWDQGAASQDDLSQYQFKLRVDGNPMDMSEISCGTLQSSGTAPCSGRLPSLTTGRHSLTLATVSPAGEESAPSSAIEVNVVRTTSSLIAPSAQEVASASARSTSHLDLDVRTMVTGLREPTDLAVTPEDSVLVAERRGVVRLVTGGLLQERPAITLEDVWAGEGAGLLGIALDPAFRDNRLVYLVYTTTDGFRVSRFREAAGTLGDRAILLDGITSSAQASAALRFGPDGKLYVALDDAGDLSRAGDLGSFNGKVLRVNADGSVPADQAGLTPVFVPNVSAARAIVWAPQAGDLWIAEGRGDGSGVLDAVMDEPRTGRRGRIAIRYALPDGDVPSSALFYGGALIKDWTGDLLVALPSSAQLVRLRLDREDATRVLSTEVVLAAAAGRIRALGADADGLVYLANDDSLLTLAPGTASAGF